MTESKPNLDSVLAYLADVVDQRRADLADGKIDASSSYIAQLFTKGDDAILKKIGLPKTLVNTSWTPNTRLCWLAKWLIYGFIAL